MDTVEEKLEVGYAWVTGFFHCFLFEIFKDIKSLVLFRVSFQDHYAAMRPVNRGHR
jgi:hypothetical protein